MDRFAGVRTIVTVTAAYCSPSLRMMLPEISLDTVQIVGERWEADGGDVSRRTRERGHFIGEGWAGWQAVKHLG